MFVILICLLLYSIAVVMYSNAKPVIVSNAAAFFSISVTPSLYNPIHRRSNITTNDNVEMN
jgi:uncharacterized phage-associated protein